MTDHAAILEKCPRTKQEIERHIAKHFTTCAPKVYAQIKSRVKGVESTKVKIATKRAGGDTSYDLDKVTDIVGFRVICHFIKDVPEVVGALMKAAEDTRYVKSFFEPIRVYTTASAAQIALRNELAQLFQCKGAKFILEEKESRYTSVHMVWTLADDYLPNNIEIQVRTVFEDAWSEIEHALKYKGSACAASVSEDMQILNTLVQGCLEFSDLIYSRSKLGTIEPIAIEHTSTDPKATIGMKGGVVEGFRHLAKSGKLPDALSGFDKEISAAEFASNRDLMLSLQHEKGSLLLEYGTPSDAFEYFAKLSDAYPNDRAIRFRMAECHKQLGDFYNAAKRFQDLFDEFFPEGTEFLPPSDTRMRQFANRLPMKLAYCYWRLGQHKAAASVVRTGFDKLSQFIDPSTRLDYLSSEAYFEMELVDQSTDRTPAAYGTILDRLQHSGVSLDVKFGFRVLDTYVCLAQKSGQTEEAQKGKKLLKKCIKAGGPDNLQGLNDNGEWRQISREEYIIVMSHIDAIS